MPRAPQPRVKAGTSKSGAQERRHAFASAYLTNGRNGTQAAITAGFSIKGAHVAANRMLKDDTVRALIAKVTEQHGAAVGLTAEKVLAEVANIAYAMPTDDIKWPDKLAGLEKAMKHLGLYERDNAQRAPSLAIQIVAVGPA